MVTTTGNALTAVYCIESQSILQGNYFSMPAVDVAWFINLTQPDQAQRYLNELSTVLQRFDQWMWSERMGLDDTLWLPSALDWGGDGADVYDGYQPPFTSMDMMGYAYQNAKAIARINGILHNSTGRLFWEGRAAKVASTLKRVLWQENRAACYDRDAKNA